MKKFLLTLFFTVTQITLVTGVQASDITLKLKPSDTPPPGLGVTKNGDVLETKQFQGKVLIVTFWASWCAPCRAELSYLERLQRRVAKDLLQVVAVNIEERDVFREATRKLHEFQITLSNDRNKRDATAYGVNGIPHMVIIGKDGKVVNVHRGYSEASIPKFIE